ncbi:MAG: lysophospholipid acyltransferase family protein [Deltaproteobacteria bacterium]|nr:lysophospholipid acyltransferase family protein [Deltaproteobacteria bacterium]
MSEISINETAASPEWDFRTKAAGYLLSTALRAINATLRWKKVGLVSDGKHWTEGSPVIMVFWHGDQLMMPWVYNPDHKPNARKDIYALISRHNDGRVAARTLEHFEVKCVDGSSTRGAARALLMLKSKLAQGYHVALTPDGPKGPRHLAKQGPVILASSLGIPLLPIAAAAHKSWTFRSWDGMFLPKPFSKMVAIAGEPFTVAGNLSREEIAEESVKLTACLNELKERAASMASSKW